MSQKVREHMGAYYGRSQKGMEREGSLQKELETYRSI